jgi:hypothetical protein
LSLVGWTDLTRRTGRTIDARRCQGPGTLGLVHHAPPAGSKVSWTGRKSAGDEYLLDWIKRFTPDIVLSGHIHNSPFYPDGDWVDRIGPTWVFNPGRQIGPMRCTSSSIWEAMTAEHISIEGPVTATAASPMVESRGRTRSLGWRLEKRLQHLIHHADVIVSFKLVLHVHQITVQCVKASSQEQAHVKADGR